ncbi:MAG: hypothetical protein ACK5HR_02985 [Mycoplasmatales bacterium]
MSTIVVDKMYQLGDNTITIKAVETDNFEAVYTSISALEIPIPISELRKLKNLTKEIELVKEGAPKFKIRKSIEDSLSEDMVLMLSSSKDIIPMNIKTSDIIDKYWEYEENEEMCQNIGIYTLKTLKVQAQQYFPCHIFKKYNCEYMKQQEDRVTKYYNKINNKYINKNSISKILEDEELKKNATRRLSSIYGSVYLGEISTKELRKYLKDYSNKLNKTDYNRLITLYDYLQYK